MNLLGCSWSYLPVIFDLWEASREITHFAIFKNIPVEGHPVIWHDPPYTYTIHEPGVIIKDVSRGVCFGVTGPKAKHDVYHCFRDQQNIGTLNYANLVHASVYRPVSVSLEGGHILEPGVILSSQARLGFGVTIKRGASIGHHADIGEFVEINPGVVLCSDVRVGRGCILGAAAAIRDGVSIGNNTINGIGSVVTKDIPEGVIAFGNPCRVVAPNDAWQI